MAVILVVATERGGAEVNSIRAAKSVVVGSPMPADGSLKRLHRLRIRAEGA
jgi:hypothetical protein